MERETGLEAASGCSPVDDAYYLAQEPLTM
jgi:hypothetical protein